MVKYCEVFLIKKKKNFLQINIINSKEIQMPLKDLELIILIIYSSIKNKNKNPINIYAKL